MDGQTRNTRNVVGGVFDCKCDEYFTLLRADDSLFQFLGFTREQVNSLFQNRILSIIAEDEREKTLHEIDEQVKRDGVFMYENRLTCSDSTYRWVWISAQLIMSDHKDPFFHCIFHDITEDKEMEEALRISEKRFEFILSQTQDIVFEYDCDTREIYYSENFEKKFGYRIPAKDFPDSMFKTNIIAQEDIAALRNGFQSILMGKDEMTCEYRLKYQNKGYRWVYAQAKALRDEQGALKTILGVITDIHDQKQEIMKSREEAAMDPLTGMYNRRECVRRVENQISISDALLAFILIDVDDFKLINDTYGHTKGDEALRRIARELQSVVRRHDVAARIGGDEFVVCLMDIPNREIAIHKAERIQNAFSMKLKEDLQCEVNCSIGISYYPEHGSTFDELLEHADIAMYQAKKEGKNRFSIFENELEKMRPTVPQKYMRKSFHDHIIEHALRILLKQTDQQSALKELMQLIGKVFNSDRITIYERHHDRYLCFQEWISDSIYKSSQKEFEIADRFNDLQIKQKLLAYTNVEQIDDAEIRQWFTNRNTLATIVYFLKGNDAVDTILCYEDCHATRVSSGEERYTLMMISEILHLFFMKANYSKTANNE